MRRMPCLVLLAIASMCSLAIAADNQDGAGKWKPLTGPAIKATLTNTELGDGTHYAYRFHANGNFDGTEMGRDRRGTWRVTSQSLCWTWIRPPGREECYAVERKGRELRGLHNGIEAWWGELTPLKPSAK